MTEGEVPSTDSLVPLWIDWVNLLIGVATLLGILVAGGWAWWKFIRFRSHKPKAQLVQTVSHHWLSGDQVLLRVSVRIGNIGNVLLRLQDGTLRLQQIHPCEPHVLQWILEREGEKEAGGTEADWPVIEERDLKLNTYEIEPGEHEELPFDLNAMNLSHNSAP